ncbi:AVAST type 3 anti-phage protein Avs3b [Mesorhizobium sp. VK9D]|uniref:AVAST type 3 anti-phage proein Avs3b n=1 Tax=Mesorhizobium australafricanum TaxID=3072311 RepID=UPI002A24D1A0|nr:AVAST type 3 anti-phage proein Avs3b [Mesorhizobium sp. VK9D]MDX8452969.1 AVAST type 3 anti-phage protein Avs3b [Mesorhizobium sp. VK9D]
MGKQIVAELGLDQSVDTLGRWMAHYIVELMHSAEAASADEGEGKRSRCAAAILELWNHRHAMPNGRRPFESFEPIVRTIESLAPDDTTPRYFRSARAAATKEDEKSESSTWLEIAEGLDYTARILISYCLACSAREAADKSKEWVRLAEAAGAMDDGYLPIIRIIAHEDELANGETATNHEREEIENRIRRLEGFTHIAEMLSKHLSAKLNLIDLAKGKSRQESFSE